MKRKCFALALTLVLLSVLTSLTFVTVSAEDTPYTFKKSTADFTLDGAVTTGEEWDTVEWTALQSSLNTPNEGYSARFKGMWKEVEGVKRIYYFIEINDTTISTFTNWCGDAFFIILNDEGTLKNTATLNLKTVENATVALGTTTTTYTSSDTRATDGTYRVEGYFPIADVETFLFDVLVQDAYDDSASEYGKYARYAWHGAKQNSFAPTGTGILDSANVVSNGKVLTGEDILGRYYIYRTLSPITLDGVASDNEAWNAVEWSSLFNKTVTGKYAGQADFQAKMKVLWQNDGANAYLYFLIETNDKTNSFGQSGWPYDYFKVAVDEDINGKNETATQARYLGQDKSDDRIQYAVDDHRADGAGYTVEVKYTFKDASNCSETVFMEAFVHDFTGTSASDTSGTCWNRYAWKNTTSGDDSANGIGLISDIPVFSVKTEEGASVRIDTDTPNKSGIRFRTTVDADAINTLTKSGATVTTGTILLPTESLTNKGITELTKENLASAGLVAGTHYYDIVNIDNEWIDGSDGLFIGTLFNIKNFTRQYSAVGYATVKLADGTEYTLYGGYSADCARSVAYVAQKALDDTSVTYTEAQKAILQNFISGGTES